MSPWSRKRFEPIALAVVSLVSVGLLRFGVEARLHFVAEMCTIALCAGLSLSKQSLFRRRLAFALPLIPVVFAFGNRFVASPVAYEMTALTAFGAMSLALAVRGTSARHRAMSLVSSGFLVLFSTSISDDPTSVALPLIWMLGCVWHLVANHWERLDVAMPVSVSRNWSVRPGTVVVAGLVLAVGCYAVNDRWTSTRKLAFGFMPTSGGSKWSDPAARSGVGTGEAAIAAKDHAESFGAVDSDIFLESTDSTLFDMVNDLIGEPRKRREKWERRQALANPNMISVHDRVAKSEKGGNTFSTDRVSPKKHLHHNDSASPDVIQWDGPTGIRLAMHRFDTFDGVDWSQTAKLGKDKLRRVDIGENVWFFDPDRHHDLHDSPDQVSVGLLKVIRLDSNRLPVPMLTSGIHIKDIDRQDFFAVEDDGCFLMPGRDRVPPLTVVHVASLALSEDEVRDGVADSGPHNMPSSDGELQSLVERVTAEDAHPYDRLRSVVNFLREEFVFDRDHSVDSPSPIETFLKDRRGGDHLFATTAALMARQIGLESRLVTGFYVPPGSFDLAAGHASVTASDVHVWAEIRLNDGRWFEIEPTPGYQPPDYRPSLWLVSKRWLVANWHLASACIGLCSIVFFTRRLWYDWLLWLVWAIADRFPTRHKLRIAMQIIEARAQLAGHRRPPGRTQREWMERLTQRDQQIRQAAAQFCDAADAWFFGQRHDRANESATRVVRLLSTRTISELSKEATQ